MSDLIELLSVALRWTHVFAAILWVGATYLFNFMEKSLERDASTPENVRGRLWMVHGGGFYFVEKQKRLEGKYGTLHWFKYESATTWVSGAILIAVSYYHGGLLVEPGQSFSAGAIAGLLTIFGGWLIYDLLVRSPIGRNELFVAALGWVSFVAASYFLRAWLSPRAVLIHIGAMIGTIMAANVWMRILPTQRKMLAALLAGNDIPPNLSATGPLRSKQNSYLAIPLVLLMITNHAPMIVGSPRMHWWIGGLFLIGFAVARVFRGPTHAGEGAPAKNSDGTMVHAALALGLLAASFVIGFRAAGKTVVASPPVAPPKKAATVGAPAKNGVFGAATLRGTVTLVGAVPEPEPWGGAKNDECRSLREATLARVRAQGGKLADVFVYVSAGLPEGTYDVPKTPVVLDQKNCEFTPRVFGLVAGQALRLGNNDAFLHNVSSPEFNQAFLRGATRDVALESPGVVTTIKCDVHPWMRAYAGVVEHPFFAVTGEDGSFEIGTLPDGELTIAAWHETLGTTEARVQATATKPRTIELTLASK